MANLTKQKNMMMKRVRFFLAVAVVLLLCASCRSVKYVPVETVRTEYVHHTDTVRQTDSVYHEKETIIREADSAMVSDLGLKLKENERAILVLKRELAREKNQKEEHKTDTIIKVDSVSVPYPVEKALTWRQHTAIKFFPWLLVCVMGCLLWIFRKPIKQLIRAVLKIP